MTHPDSSKISDFAERLGKFSSGESSNATSEPQRKSNTNLNQHAPGYAGPQAYGNKAAFLFIPQTETAPKPKPVHSEAAAKIAAKFAQIAHGSKCVICEKTSMWKLSDAL